jgi:hypothetical protein
VKWGKKEREEEMEREKETGKKREAKTKTENRLILLAFNLNTVYRFLTINSS